MQKGERERQTDLLIRVVGQTILLNTPPRRFQNVEAVPVERLVDVGRRDVHDKRTEPVRRTVVNLNER